MDFCVVISQRGKESKQPAGDETDPCQVKGNDLTLLSPDQFEQLIPTQGDVDIAEDVPPAKADHCCWPGLINFKDRFWLSFHGDLDAIGMTNDNEDNNTKQSAGYFAGGVFR
jgi:hypothetical protein